MDASSGSSAPVVAAADLRAALRQRWWVVVIVTLLGVAAAAVAVQVIPRTYKATTTVLVEATGSGESGNATAKDKLINLDTESQIVPSAAVADRVRGLLKTPATASELADQITIAIVPNATVLAISAESATPTDAQRISRTFAKAYLDQREETAKAGIAAQTKLFSAQIADTNKQLEAAAGKVAALAANSPDKAFAEAQQRILTDRVSKLTQQLSDLQAIAVTPGRVLSDAALPTDPEQPPPYLLLLAGLLFGLILGIAIAMLLARLDRRVRRPGDIHNIGDVVLLGSIPPGRPGRGGSMPAIAPSMSPIGQAFGQVRNDVTTALPRRPATLLIAGTEAGSANSLVAANLAVAMARSGASVLLVCADLTGSTAERMLGLEGLTRADGLAEALSGQAEPITLLRAAPVVPGLWVLGVGHGGDSAAELLQSRQLEWVLSAVQGESFVILEAPPTSAGAEAQAMARLCDAAILVSEVGRSKLDDIDDGAHQLARVGTRLLGVVVSERQSPPARKRKGATRVTIAVPDPAERLAAGLGENTVAITPDQLTALRAAEPVRHREAEPEAPRDEEHALPARAQAADGGVDGLPGPVSPAEAPGDLLSANGIGDSTTYVSSTVYRFVGGSGGASRLPDARDLADSDHPGDGDPPPGYDLPESEDGNVVDVDVVDVIDNADAIEDDDQPTVIVRPSDAGQPPAPYDEAASDGDGEPGGSACYGEPGPAGGFTLYGESAPDGGSARYGEPGVPDDEPTGSADAPGVADDEPTDTVDTPGVPDDEPTDDQPTDVVEAPLAAGDGLVPGDDEQAVQVYHRPAGDHAPARR